MPVAPPATTLVQRLPLPVMAVAGLAGCSGPRSALDPAGPAADAIASVWWLMFYGAVLIWLLVVVLFLWALWRRQPAEGEHVDAAQRERRAYRLITCGGLALPTVALLALLTYGTVGSSRITAVGQPVDWTIDVVARQFQWEFRYHDADGEVVATSVDALAMPVAQLVEFQVRSEDVVHSFWIPRLGGKIDAIPGRVNTLRLRADHDGQGTPIRGQCAELCGLEHAFMHFTVHVMEADAFVAWLADPTPLAAPEDVAP